MITEVISYKIPAGQAEAFEKAYQQRDFLRLGENFYFLEQPVAHFESESGKETHL
jgi:hypothetical protein